MTELKKLRGQIRSLRRRREIARCAMATSAPLLAVIWLMIGVFSIDVLFEMTRSQRVVALVAATGVLAWVLYRYVWPWLAYREDDIDVALLVERGRGIDSDLVAGLQFESPGAARWGSPQLKHAVVRQVAEDTRQWNLAGDFRRRGLPLRLGFCAGSVAIVALAWLVFPAHAAIFMDRLAMASTFYPTNTVIRDVAVNDEPKGPIRSTDVVVACPVGRPVNFRVACDGELPRDGRIVYWPEGGKRSVIVLESVENERGVYAGRLERMVNALEFMVSVGDARTRRAQLVVSPRPVVQPIFKPTVPAYAAVVGAKPDNEGLSFSVYKGSRVDLQVQCLNKPLKEVTLIVSRTRFVRSERTVENKQVVETKKVVEANRCPLLQVGEGGRLWELPTKDTPFHEIKEPLRYEIEAKDKYDMRPKDKISGRISLKDAPPVIEANIAKRQAVYVLPTAKPCIRYWVNDDFGLRGLKMHVEIRRANGTVEEPQAFSIFEPQEPLTAPQLPLSKAFTFDLTGFRLRRKDEVEIRLEATDYRGRLPGLSAKSDPLTLKVTDEIGLWRELIEEVDKKSERKIRQIINSSTGIERTKQ